MPPPSSLHRPRKRRKIGTVLPSTGNHEAVFAHSASSLPQPAFPLVSFLWPARKSTSQWVTLPLILMVVGLFRWAVGLWGFSGFQSPPMHGDFEAQRHWMEITTKLPVAQWYFYDLEWWGLDYPPLTAYHSWILGKIGSIIDPIWFELDNSRAIETPHLKVYMRATVLISEYLIYIPSVVIFLRRYARNQSVNLWEGTIALVAILMQPATMLIDHAHFQYNTVMLGLIVACLSSIFADRRLWACAFFVGALGFKQMALYYAPAIFAYLLGSCLFPRPRPFSLVLISLITVLSFAIIYAPFILGVLYDESRGISFDFSAPSFLDAIPYEIPKDNWSYPLILEMSQSIHRIFPFARGLFEDKVANFWCAIHTFHKLHRYPVAMLQRYSLLATLASITPSLLITLFCPRKEVLPWAFSSTAWGFFLFSFQVHEKSVLLPLLPMTLLLASHHGLNAPKRAWVGFANALGTWTMFPLLKRDELRVPYFVLLLLWTYLMGLPPTSFSAYFGTQPAGQGMRILTKLIHLGFYIVMVAWHVLEGFVQTPEGKPDLWVVLNVLIGAGGFGLCYLWCTWGLITTTTGKKGSPKKDKAKTA
ncbi:MAG: Glucosyltransferase-like protein [Cirrosporium novae-zelandiae]|nr:MAG: Glucosyltransferase-like protein [Cirrosporium novae-zelandiae]